MEEETKQETSTKKFTYEQLEQIAGSLSTQVQQLTNRLQESNMFNMFKRLDYLFKVLELSSKFNEDFVNKCIKEVEEIMTPSTEETKE